MQELIKGRCKSAKYCKKLTFYLSSQFFKVFIERDVQMKIHALTTLIRSNFVQSCENLRYKVKKYFKTKLEL